ncbi:glucosaminidase domain-containing protein [Parabacteroides sp.]
MEKRLFVKMYGEAARTAGELFGMNPVVILAQGAIESGWGESVLAVKYHNFFGIAGYGVANAYWHGGKTDLGNGGLLFRRYDTPEHGFMDFARLVSSAYPQAAAVSFYPEAYAQEIAYSRYISEANGDNRAAYCRTLRRIAVDIGLIASFK